MNIRILCIAFCLLSGASSSYAADFNDKKPNAGKQSPAFSGQTRAPVINDSVRLKREVIASGLEHPWGLDQLPDGRWLVTERPGRLRIVSQQGEISAPVQGLPEVDARGQGGLLDVLIGEDFNTTRQLWWSYAEPRGNGTNATAVATGRLSTDERRVENVKVIFQQQPAWSSTLHYGSRLVFDQTGALFVTTGERSKREPRQLAQDVTTHLGKVIRIKPSGGAADGNPDIAGGLPDIWSYGHRNLQSAALAPDGQLWTVEHGPRGGDELNQPKAGLNYGWPVISYGEEYTGLAVGKGLTARPGMEQPVYYWDPVIAPSGMAFYQGEMFSAWQGSVLIGGLRSQALVRLTLDDRQVTGEARYLEGQGRVRDIDIASDGAVILIIDDRNGELIRVTPQ